MCLTVETFPLEGGGGEDYIEGDEKMLAMTLRYANNNKNLSHTEQNDVRSHDHRDERKEPEPIVWEDFLLLGLKISFD